jgi:hypothetical protein
MKKFWFAVLWAAAAGVHAQTNFPVLNTLDGRSFTNVTVSSATPAYIIALYDGGGTKLYFTNLEPSVRDMFHFDPEKADSFADGEAASKRKVQANIQAATEAELKAENAVGEIQTVQVLLHLEYYKYRINVGNQDVVFLNLPSSVTQFLDTDTGVGAKAPSDTPKPQSRRARRAAASAAATPAPSNAASNNVAKVAAEKTTILARPTGKIVGGLRVWQFAGFPDAATNAAALPAATPRAP